MPIYDLFSKQLDVSAVSDLGTQPTEGLTNIRDLRSNPRRGQRLTPSKRNPSKHRIDFPNTKVELLKVLGADE